jgi:hypothetical protein
LNTTPSNHSCSRALLHPSLNLQDSFWDIVGRELEDSFDFSAWEELLSSGDPPSDDTPAAAASDVDEDLQGKQADTPACLCFLPPSSH